MIVVVGSRHDPVAAALVESWQGAVLCTAEDLVRPGWNWRSVEAAGGRWVIGGQIFDDANVTGVFVRRSGVYPEEFASTHPDDRAYLAAEAHAFLIFVLSATRAKVANPVINGALGEEAIRTEHWVAAAEKASTPIVPLRITNRWVPQRTRQHVAVEVVGGEAFGTAPARSRTAALRIVSCLGLVWAAVLFDRRQRLITVTTARPPSEEAAAALGRVLATPAAA